MWSTGLRPHATKVAHASIAVRGYTPLHAKMRPMEDPAPDRGVRRPLLRTIVWLLPALAFVGVLAASTIQRSGPATPGDVAPEFEAPLLDGAGTFALSESDGKPVMLNFWASWCGPCEEEGPLLRDAHELYGDRVAFVGIDIRDSRTEALEFVERHGLAYPHVRDESLEIYDDYGLTGQPESFFIDDEGVIVEHIPGVLTEDTLFQLLDVLVARSGG